MSNENISPATIRRIAMELKDLTTNPPEDIRLIPCEDDITDIQANITGPAGTPYEGGVFRVKLKLGSEFPAAPPKGFFLTKIFHPNVSKNGEICVNTLKKDWKEDLGIKHVLLTIKCLLIVPNPESALNEEAGRLLLEQYEDYARTAKLFTSIHAVPRDQKAQDKEVDGNSTKEASSGIENKKTDKNAPAADPNTMAKKRNNNTAVMKKKKSLKRL
eukprot:TRINITY_DN8696_c0_g1_i1.p1 TRINITY_DN8696_c0_g1~~TRINITY_DN8696_c0_g1_i1.p1  ORF type:complete len:216 (+),score=65.53 TRINITY_DN8696_c0_g1_i1:212-859(+)